MSEFRVGDRVRVRATDTVFGGRTGWIAAECTDGMFTHNVRFEESGAIFGFNKHELELVESGAISPTHYQFPSGVQVIDITRHLDFLSGNVVKYVARAGKKGDALEDLYKARQYLNWLIEDREAGNG